MKRSPIITTLTLLLFCTFFTSSVFAESQADKYLGERKMCLDVVKIKDTQILDDQTILFELYGGIVYISRLPISCDGLRAAGGFSYKTANGKLCKQETIRIVDEGPFNGSACGLGEFIQLKGVNRLSGAVKLLKEEGILKALVEEGVFKTAFPPDKS